MKIKEINNDDELDKALKRLDEIWSARPGEIHWEERVSLFDMIEAYEDETVHIPSPSPIDAIRFRMEQSGTRYRNEQ